MSLDAIATKSHDELWDLENLQAARRLCDWMYEQSSPFVRGEVIEIGAGIGTFSTRIAANPEVTGLLLVEPEPACAEVLDRTFAHQAQVSVSRDTLPESPAVSARAGEIDFVLCQNVLEHIADDGPAVRAMADALRPGGRLTLLVPAHPWLYGKLDRIYAHHRRYTRARVRSVVEQAGLVIDELYSFNMLGVPGWWLNRFRSAPGITPSALRAYELLMRAWKPVEQRWRPPIGLSVIVQAHKPE